MFNCRNQLLNYRDENTYDIFDYKNKKKTRLRKRRRNISALDQLHELYDRELRPTHELKGTFSRVPSKYEWTECSLRSRSIFQSETEEGRMIQSTAHAASSPC